MVALGDIASIFQHLFDGELVLQANKLPQGNDPLTRSSRRSAMCNFDIELFCIQKYKKKIGETAALRSAQSHDTRAP